MRRLVVGPTQSSSTALGPVHPYDDLLDLRHDAYRIGSATWRRRWMRRRGPQRSEDTRRQAERSEALDPKERARFGSVLPVMPSARGVES